MSTIELEKVTKAWPPISSAVRVPHTEAEYHELVEPLDHLTDKVGEDEKHPLVVEKYEDEQVAEFMD